MFLFLLTALFFANAKKARHHLHSQVRKIFSQETKRHNEVKPRMDDLHLEAPFSLEECDEEASYHAMISSLIP
jgi:hypothetical protein